MSNLSSKISFLVVYNLDIAEKIIIGLYDADLVNKSGMSLPAPSQDIDADSFEKDTGEGMLDIPNAAYGAYLRESAAIRMMAEDLRRRKKEESPSPAP